MNGSCLRGRRAQRGRSSLRVAATLLIGLGTHGAALAQTPSANAPDGNRQRLEQVQEALKQKKAAEQALRADVDQLMAERQRINESRIETARQIQLNEGQLTAIEGRLGELEAQEKLLRGSLAERHGSILKLLAVMQRMGRDPPPVMITKREDVLSMVRSAMLLASAFPQLKSKALELSGQLEDLGRVMGESRSQSEKLVQQQQSLREAHIRLSSLQEEKRRILTERQEQLERVRREAEEIAKSAPDLPTLLQKYDEVVLRQAKEALAQAPETPAAPMQAPGPVASAEPGKPTAKHVPQEPAPAVVLAPKAGLKIASLNSGRIKPAIPFADAKGRLPLPVQGKRLIAFGDKTHASRSSGIVIETRGGAQVVSPTDGWVVFAGVFRSYGQILIINAGDGYHMLLAGLSQIDVQLGQFVLAGEPVGLMNGAPLGAKPKPVGNAPVLYIELRKDGRSIDPDPWWASEGTQKVQG